MFKAKKISLSLFIFLTLLSSITSCEKMLKLEYAKNKGFPWELTVNFLSQMKDIFNSDTFIETGTWLGYTTQTAAKVFNQIETVELSKEIYEKAKNSLSSNKNVTCHFGDSALILKHMIKSANGKILFWLDGHYSGGPTAYGDRTTPIIDELQTIKESSIKNSVILIDDICLFDESAYKAERQDVSGYPRIDEICSLLNNINPDYDIILLGNILLAYEKSESVKVSEVLKASTLLRINPIAPIDELAKAERAVSKAQDVELETINALYSHFCTNEHRNLYEAYGVGSHYALCYSLTLLNRNKKDEALKILNGPIKLGLNKNYLDGLINRINSDQI